MWPFRKKNTYRITWSYYEGCSHYTEIIKAKDIAAAWEKLLERRPLAKYLISIERISEK